MLDKSKMCIKYTSYPQPHVALQPSTNITSRNEQIVAIYSTLYFTLSFFLSQFISFTIVCTKSMPFNGSFRKRLEQAQIMTYYVQ